MPEMSITVCGRKQSISCGEGEEQNLLAAADLLNSEALALLKRDERLTEQKVLLMAGLVLADRSAVLERDLHAAKDKAIALERAIATLEETHTSVPTIPEAVVERLSDVASRAEELATMIEERTAVNSG